MNFRKGTALLIALVMLVSNAGFAMTVHYCGGKISSITSGFAFKETCKMSGKTKSGVIHSEPAREKACCAKKIESNHKKCCSDKTVSFKAKTTDLFAKSLSFEITAPFLAPVFAALIFTPSAVCKTEIPPAYYCDAHAPPLFKLYHQYLLYA